MTLSLRLIVLFLFLGPVAALAGPPLPAAFQGMTPDQAQRAIQEMTPAQFKQAAPGMTPSQVVQAAAEMTSARLPQASPAMPPPRSPSSDTARGASEFQQSYGQRRTSEFQQSYGQRRTSEFQQPYGQRRTSEFQQPYGQRRTSDFQQPYGQRRTSDFQQPYPAETSSGFQQTPPPMTRETLQQALHKMTPAQFQKIFPGMTPNQVEQTAAGMTPDQVQQAMQRIPPSVLEQIAEESASEEMPRAFSGMTPDQIQQAYPEISPEEKEKAAPGTVFEPHPPIDPSMDRRAGMQALEPLPPSPLEALYRTHYSSWLAEDLDQFGYDLFQASPLVGLPSRLAVPDPDYLLGPGDVLRIRIWGAETDANYTGAISKDGTLNVPRIGIVPLSGLKFSDVEGVLRESAEKYVQGINISVSLGRLRSMEIYVVGSIYRPGLHMVPAFSTVLGALMAAGGVEKSGSLRNIKLFRNGAEHRAVDIYDLLLRGSRKSDIMLKDRDVVFVPRIGPTLAMAGAVAEPGIYELKGEETIGQALALAGNILPQSYTGRMHLRRFDDNDEFVIQDIDTKESGADWHQIQIQDGDFIEVPLLADVQQPLRRTVRLNGHVWRPDLFRYRPGLKLSDILVSPDLLKPEALTDYALLHRYDKGTTRKTTHRFPLHDVFAGSYDAELRPLDEIQILSRAELNILESVEITGAVWNPVQTAFRPQMTVRDLLALGGGLRDDQAFMDYGYLYRYDPALLDYRLQRIPLPAVISGQKTIALKPFDRVRILSRIDFDMRYSVTLAGAVWKPDTFNFNPGITLSDLITLGGGTKYGADTSRITLTRKEASADRMDAIHRVVDLDESKDLPLQPYDAVFVPQIKDADKMREVTINGEVRFPGTYAVRENERLSELIARAGGFTREAYYFGARYLSASARVIQQNSLEKLLDDLEIRANMFMSEMAQTGISREAIEGAKASQMGLESFIKKLRSVRAEGRVAIQLTDLTSFKGSGWDFVLEDGDALMVPKKPNFVAVVGSVYSPSAYLYQSDETVADYLEKSGGPTKSADEEYMYVLKANGEVFSNENAGSFRNRFSNQRLMPGDTIVVPEDLEKVPYLRLTKDITEIVFKIATTAGIAVAAL
jgi:polysaccharide biosynthesis/export protein